MTGERSWKEPNVMEEATAVEVPGVAAFMPSVCAFNAQPLPTPLQRALAILSAVLDDAHPIQEEFEPYDPKMIELDPSGGVSRTLDNAEVRANIMIWVEAIQNEVDTLVETTPRLSANLRQRPGNFSKIIP